MMSFGMMYEKSSALPNIVENGSADFLF